MRTITGPKSKDEETLTQIGTITKLSTIMDKERTSRLCNMLLEYPHIHKCIDDDFIRSQYKIRLNCHILKRLDNKQSSTKTLRHLPSLEKRLAELSSIVGYDRLCPLLRSAADWDQYQEYLDQIDITLWFKSKSLLKEIEPELPGSRGKADILVSFRDQPIYCEVSSFQSIGKSIQSEKYQHSSSKDIHRIDRILRTSLRKTHRQLPQDYAGIFALSTTKSNVLSFDVRQMAQRLFLNRQQVTLIMLWSWENNRENDSSIKWAMDNPDYCFINSQAIFRKLGETLLCYLEIRGEVIGV